MNETFVEGCNQIKPCSTDKQHLYIMRNVSRQKYEIRLKIRMYGFAEIFQFVNSQNECIFRLNKVGLLMNRRKQDSP